MADQIAGIGADGIARVYDGQAFPLVFQLTANGAVQLLGGRTFALSFRNKRLTTGVGEPVVVTAADGADQVALTVPAADTRAIVAALRSVAGICELSEIFAGSARPLQTFNVITGVSVDLSGVEPGEQDAPGTLVRYDVVTGVVTISQAGPQGWSAAQQVARARPDELADATDAAFADWLVTKAGEAAAGAIGDAQTATAAATTQAAYAKGQGDYAKAQGAAAKAVVDQQTTTLAAIGQAKSDTLTARDAAAGSATAASGSAGTAAGAATATAADRTATGQDRTGTGQDRIQTSLDRTATGQDRTQTGTDRVQTGQDRTATGQDRTQTSLDRTAADGSATAAAGSATAAAGSAGAAAGSATSTAADRVQTGQDRTATGQDRVQTGVDRAAVSAIANTGVGKVAASWAALALVTGTTDGGYIVPDSDTGTHTDPVVGGTVANAGTYRWSTSPAGWQRVSASTALQVATQAAAVSAALAGVAFGTTGAITNSGYDSLTQRGASGCVVAKAATGYAYFRQSLVTQVPPGGTVTLVAVYDDGAIAPSPKASLFKPGTGAVSASTTLAVDGSIGIVTLTNTSSTVTATDLEIETNGIAAYGVTYFMIAGDPTATGPATIFAGIVQALAAVMKVARPDPSKGYAGGVTGALTQSMTSVSQVALNSFTASQTASAYKTVTQALVEPVAVGGKVTVFVYADDGAIAPSAKVSLAYNGGVLSTQTAYAIDGSVSAIVLTNTGAAAATKIQFETNGIAAYTISYAVVPGDVTSATPAKNSSATPMTILNMFARRVQKDGVLRDQVMVQSGAPANVSYDGFTANGYNEVAFSATGTATNNQYWRVPISNVAAGGTLFLVYQLLPGSQAAVVGAPKAYFDSNGGGAATAQQALIADGGVHVLPFTVLAGLTAKYLNIISSLQLVDAKLRWTILRGSPTDTAPQLNGMQAGLVAMANLFGSDLVSLRGIMANAISETWTATEAQPLFPKNFCCIAGREVRLHGPYMLRGVYEGHRIRIAIINKMADADGSGVGVFTYLNPLGRFDPVSLKSDSFMLATRWFNDPTRINYKQVTHRIVPAGGVVGKTLDLVTMGDSTTGLLQPRLVVDLEGVGLTVVQHGQKTITNAGRTFNYEGVPGTSLSDWVGKTRPTTWLNEYLRTATAADKQNNPTLCFSDTSSYGTAARPSYTDDAGASASYSIFDYETWRQARVAAGETLPATTKLVMVLQLWINNFSIADMALYGAYIVANFQAVFASGKVVISHTHDLSGVASGTVSGDGDAMWRSRWAPAITELLRQFDNDAAFAKGIAFAPSHAMQDPMFSGAVVSTTVDAQTGVTTGTFSDYIHEQNFGPQSHAEAVLGALAWWAYKQ